jgi:hypothetical protein
VHHPSVTDMLARSPAVCCCTVQGLSYQHKARPPPEKHHTTAPTVPGKPRAKMLMQTRVLGKDLTCTRCSAACSLACWQRGAAANNTGKGRPASRAALMLPVAPHKPSPIPTKPPRPACKNAQRMIRSQGLSPRKSRALLHHAVNANNNTTRPQSKPHACQPPTAILAGPVMQSSRLATSAAAVHGQLCGTPAVLHDPGKHQRGGCTQTQHRYRCCCRSTAAYIRTKRRWVYGQRTNHMCKRCSTPHAPGLRWLPATVDVQLPAKQRTHVQAAAMHTVPPHMHTPQQHQTDRPSYRNNKSRVRMLLQLLARSER